MEYRVLGKLEALRDGHPVDLGAFRQRALLALLLTAPNSVFSTDQIIDGLWGADGGIDKQNALWVYVSGLRKALEPDREKRSEGSILLTRAPGVPHRGGTGGDRCGPLRADGRRGPGARRRRPGGGVARARRGVGAVAGPGVRGLHLRVLRADRDRPARGAAARGSRGADRCRSQTRDVPGADLRVGVARPSASAAGTPDRPVDARAVPVGASGRRAAGVPTAQVTAGRGARHRAVVGAAQARGADRHG